MFDSSKKKRTDEEKRYFASPAGQKQMWAEAQGLPSDHYAQRATPVYTDGRDTGADPLGDLGEGFRWKMHPSGDIVNLAEREKRLGRTGK